MNRIRRKRPRNQRMATGASLGIGTSGRADGRLVPKSGGSKRVRERSMALQAALRDKRDAVANQPIDRAEARARTLGGSAWSRHRVLKRRAVGANADDRNGSGTEVKLSGSPSPATASTLSATSSTTPTPPLPPMSVDDGSPERYSRADRAVVGLVLVPLLFFAMGVSAMKSLNATSAKPTVVAPAWSLQHQQSSSPAATASAAASISDRVAVATSRLPSVNPVDKPAGAASPHAGLAVKVGPVPPLPNGEQLTVAVLSATVPDALPTVPAQDLAAVDAASTLIPAIGQESELYSGRDRRCAIEDEPIAPGLALLAALARSDASAADFGQALAEAAQQQLGEFVVYTDSYKRLSFPMGDVPSLFGVCTDVVIRAYRTVGVDLQRLVHRARVGSGDPNIDHRRTEVLRRFFAANGRSLSVTDVADDYFPGDIVTYYRPQNKGSQSHIAIVSNTKSASGRPLIVHNRGWGPQLEDALFVDQITGHYRYRGRNESMAAGATSQRRAAPLAKSVTRSLTWSRKVMISRAKARSSNRAAVRQSGPERARSAKPVSGS